MGILQEAIAITEGDRQRDYDHPLFNFTRIAIIWSVYLQKNISPIDVAWMMIGMKVAREANTPKWDNLLDTIGYAKCVDDMATLYCTLEVNGVITEELKIQAINKMKNMTLAESSALLEKLENGRNKFNANISNSD